VKRRRATEQLTAHVPREVAAEIRDIAAARGLSVSAATGALLAEALRQNVEHQHGALIEATIERVLHARLERVDIMAYKAARESYRSRWLTAALLELLGDRMPAKPGQAAIDRASLLNTESYRKARASLGESEDGWQAPS
jgi:L-rhamnose isomerase